ncbi:MAG: hypothetical protein AAF636_26735 [Pseudomonadota bacterium]
MTSSIARLLTPLVVSGALLAPVTAQADNLTIAEQALNRSAICTSLPEFDVQEIAKLLGYDLPKLPFVDTKARWDKSRHRVGAFEANDPNFRLEGTLGCQPSGQSAAIKAFPISDDDVRLSDNFRCNGSLSAQGAVTALSCSVSGEIGKLLAQQLDLDSLIMAALNEI